MKVFLFSMLFSVVAFTFSFAQQSPRITTEGKNVSIAYGQPSKKGRTIFGAEGSQSLEKYNKIWRTGANKSTEITFNKDVKFGGQSVKAGTYTLFTIPGDKKWTVILNTVLGQSGAFEYEKNKSKDIVTVSVPAKKFKTSEEKLTFRVSDKSLEMQWDQEGFAVPIK